MRTQEATTEWEIGDEPDNPQAVFKSRMPGPPPQRTISFRSVRKYTPAQLRGKYYSSIETVQSME